MRLCTLEMDQFRKFDRPVRLAGLTDTLSLLFGGAILKDNGEEAGPGGDGSLAAAPFVCLAGSDAGKPCEGGLGDIGAGQQRGEHGVGEPGHVVSIEQSSM
jgi:hypothetical protein